MTAPPQRRNFSMESRHEGSFPIVAYCVNGATLHGFLALSHLFRAFRLLCHDRISHFLVSLEAGGTNFPAEITVYALIVDIKFSGRAPTISIFLNSHHHRCKDLLAKSQ
jgi:hypothetical protein